MTGPRQPHAPDARWGRRSRAAVARRQPPTWWSNLDAPTAIGCVDVGGATRSRRGCPRHDVRVTGTPLVLDRRRVLAHRLRAHGLLDRESGLREFAVLGLHGQALGLGVQDTPSGALRTALSARLAAPLEPDADLTADGALTVVWSHRGAPHLPATRALTGLAAAVWPVSDADAAARLGWQRRRLAEVGGASRNAIRTVADAVSEVLRDCAGLPRSELSSAVTALVPKTLAPSCPPCDVHHVGEQLLRLAGLAGGLRLRAGARPMVAEPIPDRPGPPADDDADPSAVIDGYLRFFAPRHHRRGGRLPRDHGHGRAALSARGPRPRRDRRPGRAVPAGPDRGADQHKTGLGPGRHPAAGAVGPVPAGPGPGGPHAGRGAPVRGVAVARPAGRRGRRRGGRHLADQTEGDDAGDRRRALPGPGGPCTARRWTRRPGASAGSGRRRACGCRSGEPSPTLCGTFLPPGSRPGETEIHGVPVPSARPAEPGCSRRPGHVTRLPVHLRSTVRRRIPPGSPHVSERVR
jgi:hypothetical protein